MVLKTSLVLAVAAVFGVAPVLGAEVPAVRVVRDFDNDWRFMRGDAAGAEAVGFADKGWRALSVPHDWSIEGPYAQNAATTGAGGFLPAGIGWYRKSFALDAGQAGKKFFIDFDGVMANSDVWINGFHLGKRPYGFISFEYEMTGHLKFDGTENVLAVRADNSAEPAARFYIGAGIYRHVRLVATDAVHIEKDGTFVTTPKVAAAGASVHVRSSVMNESDAARAVAVRVRVLAPDGTEVASGETKAQSVPAGKSVDFAADVVVASPKIWDLEHPDLYTAVATVTENGAAIDDQAVPFGIRSFEFNGQTGFSLNGKNFKLKGVCLHAEAGGLGAAVPEDEWIYRLRNLKELGVNAVRTAHNPPSPEFLDACDRVGMLVMDEMFDCWDVAKTRADYHLYFDQWHLQDTQDTVRRDRNHPSIILYSAGNEIHDTPNAEKAKAILGPLVKTFHDNDPTRPVTQALFRPNSDNEGGAYRNGLSDLLDVVGTNYRDAELVAAHRAKPSISIIGTENGKTLANWAIVRDTPFYAGHFIWTGVDYLGESKMWPAVGTPDGILDITDRAKAEGYERASWWSTKPVVYMARAGGQVATGKENPDEPQERFTAFVDWTPANLQAHAENVQVFSNCDEVELFLNGQSLGSKPRGAVDSVRMWRVNFAAGTLRAVGKNRGAEVATQELSTAGKAAKVKLVSSTDKLFADFDSVAHVTASVVDEKGVELPGANDLITFKVAGPGEIEAVETGALVAQSYRGNSHYAYMGECTVFVRATSVGDGVTLTASAPGLGEGKLVMTAGAGR